jgi:hypothetical protein
MAVADWSTPRIWPFSIASGAFGTPIVLASGYPGIVTMVPDPFNDAWALTYTGQLYNIGSGGSVTLETTYPSGQVYAGLTFVSGGNAIYALSASGGAYPFPSSVSGVVSGQFGYPVKAAAASPNTLYTLLPTVSGVGMMSISGGVTGVINLPATINLPSALLYASGLLVVAGSAFAPMLSGAAAAALNPLQQTYMLAAASGAALLWTAPGPYADAWSQSAAVTGLNTLNAVAWRPDTAQALLSSSGANTVQVLSSGAGTLALVQTLSVSGAGSLVVAGSSIDALVCQPGLSQVLPLYFTGGVWASGVPTTGLANAFAAVPCGVSGALVAYASGFASILVTGGVATVQSTTPLGFSPTAACSDSFGNLYLAGSGAVAQYTSGGIFTASGTWAGAAPAAIVVQQGRILMPIPGDNLLRIYAQSTPGILSQQNSYAFTTASATAMALSNTTLFLMTSGATQLRGFSGTPFALTHVRAGAVATYSGSSWTSTVLGVGNIPSAIAYDASGNLQIVTIQNTWWTLTSGSVLTSGIVPQYAGQKQSVPLGPSSLLAASGHLYCATSLPGVLIELE